ncbi:MAG: T9SS type A sorting domain-containing protein [Bacteroidota bacterium]
MKTNLLRTLVFSCVLCLVCLSLQAQWVSIPDTNFGKWLNTNGYVVCMQGNSQVGWQMDTSCPVVMGTTSVICNLKNISNLTGIQYFDSLQILKFGQNSVSSLPVLPSSLRTLTCNDNLFTILPLLPNGLANLLCSQNQLSTLPVLPDSLVYLSCWGNQLTSIVALPNSLTELHCHQNQLAGLPALPNSLEILYCRSNVLVSLPSLPNSLTQLTCYQNQLSSLPALPNGLTFLDCSANQLTNLPALPDSLVKLICYDNQLASMPALPEGLLELHCFTNQLTSIPDLPQYLTYLNCSENQIVNLPALPIGLVGLVCGDNLLNSLPELPDSLGVLSCNRNLNLECLPRLKKIRSLSFFDTPVTCLPNYPQYNVSTYPQVPLCDAFNTNGCDVFWNVSGQVYFDDNGNCIKDSADKALMNIPVNLWSNGSLIQQMFSVSSGHYSFDTDNNGTYTIQIDTAHIPFRIVCPANGLDTVSVTTSDSLFYSKDFAVECRSGVDLEVRSISARRIRPASLITLEIHLGSSSSFFGVNCAMVISGTVTVTISGPVVYISPANGALTPIANGNVLTYQIADFGNVNFSSDFNIILLADTNAQLNSVTCFTVLVTPDTIDNNPGNNTLTQCFTIVGSFDPNDKQVYPVSDVDINGEKWLTYTVNFQNTGTDTAYHIYVTDTLDADLDASTFQLLAYSHQPMVQLKENAVRFNFPNIMLVDSHANEPLSHGYVQYKIKIKDGKPVGTVINNTAFIYFDFNAPVVTNTTSNTIAVINSVGEVRNQKSEIRVYPNPASNSVTISVDETMLGATATITDITGRKMATVHLQTVNSKLSTENFSSGVYFVTVSNGGGSGTQKLAIQH